ncbi:MAG: GntR family transcriptional regulator [Chitinivibrionales bacterium]|nr:GntR family transcriptional regulator [Chitinivibrionales bacterium]
MKLFANLHASNPSDCIISLSRPVREELPPRPSVPAAGRIELYLENRILSSAWLPETTVPSMKELSSRLATSYPTLRAALESLVRRGLLEPRGRGYRVPPVSTRRSHARIVLFEPGYQMGKMTITPGLSQEFLHLLEQECSRSSIGLDIVGISEREGRMHYIDIAGGNIIEPRSLDYAAGYLYAATMSRSDIAATLSELYVHNKPVAILDMLGDLAISPAIQNSPRFCRFAVSTSAACARQIGRYLLAQGHRRLAFISPFHAWDWSRKRVEGLQQVCAAGGNIASVKPFALDTFIRRLQFSEQARKRNDIAMLSMPREAIDAMPFPYRRVLDLRMEIELQNCYIDAEIYAQCIPLFEQALADKDISAWVPVNDQIAAFALDFLRSRGVKVPDDISLIAFDDSPVALKERITSYNFNMRALVPAMLEFVLRPSASPTASRRTVEGYIVERQTTRGKVQ